ncbi:Myb- protein B, partial [Mycoemilia scoparia]
MYRLTNSTSALKKCCYINPVLRHYVNSTFSKSITEAAAAVIESTTRDITKLPPKHTYKQWTAAEKSKLIKLASTVRFKEDSIDWETIGQKMGRTGSSCFSMYYAINDSNVYKSHTDSSIYNILTNSDSSVNKAGRVDRASLKLRWTPREIENLKTAVALFGPSDWELVSGYVETRDKRQCCQWWHYNYASLEPNIDNSNNDNSNCYSSSSSSSSSGTLRIKEKYGLLANDFDFNSTNKPSIDSVSIQEDDSVGLNACVRIESVANDNSPNVPYKPSSDSIANINDLHNTTTTTNNNNNSVVKDYGLVDIDWTPEQDKRLIDLVSEHGRRWVKIQKLFTPPDLELRWPYRTHYQLNFRFKKLYSHQMFVKGRWTKAEDEKLIELVKMHGTKWETISESIRTRSGNQCRQRWLYTLRAKYELHQQQTQDSLSSPLNSAVKTSGGGGDNKNKSMATKEKSHGGDINEENSSKLRTGKWSKQEDERLISIIKDMNSQNNNDAGDNKKVELVVSSWQLVALRHGTRTKLQCHYRWTQHLRPKILLKNTNIPRSTDSGFEQWTLDEDRIILEMCREIDKKNKKIQDNGSTEKTHKSCRHRPYSWAKIRDALKTGKPTHSIRGRKLILYNIMRKLEISAGMDPESLSTIELAHKLAASPHSET